MRRPFSWDGWLLSAYELSGRLDASLSAFMLHGKASRRSRSGSLLRDVIGVQSGDCLIDTIPKRLGRVLHMGAGAGLH